MKAVLYSVERQKEAIEALQRSPRIRSASETLFGRADLALIGIEHQLHIQ